MATEMAMFVSQNVIRLHRFDQFIDLWFLVLHQLNGWLLLLLMFLSTVAISARHQTKNIVFIGLFSLFIHVIIGMRYSLFYAIRNVVFHGCYYRRWFLFFWHFCFAETTCRQFGSEFGIGLSCEKMKEFLCQMRKQNGVTISCEVLRTGTKIYKIRFRNRFFLCLRMRRLFAFRVLNRIKYLINIPFD